MTAGNRERIYHTTSIRYAEPLRPSREAAGYGCPTTLSLRCRGVYGVPRWQTQLAAPLVLRGQHRRSPDLGCAQFGGGAHFLGRAFAELNALPPSCDGTARHGVGWCPAASRQRLSPRFSPVTPRPRLRLRPRRVPQALSPSELAFGGSDNDNCVNGGWGGIRTPGEREPTPVFKTGALNHSATHPMQTVPRLGEPAAAHI